MGEQLPVWCHRGSNWKGLLFHRAVMLNTKTKYAFQCYYTAKYLTTVLWLYNYKLQVLRISPSSWHLWLGSQWRSLAELCFLYHAANARRQTCRTGPGACIASLALLGFSSSQSNTLLHKHAAHELTPRQLTAISCAYACEAEASFTLTFGI